MHNHYCEKKKKDNSHSLICEVDNSHCISLVLILKKRNGKVHVSIDYRTLNQITKREPFLIPSTVDVLEPGSSDWTRTFEFSFMLNLVVTTR
jgi:hypothetical protein